jgi:hypothetical protein
VRLAAADAGLLPVLAATTRRAHHRIYGSAECGALLEGGGFRVERVERFRVGWLWGMMTLTARVCA